MSRREARTRRLAFVPSLDSIALFSGTSSEDDSTGMLHWRYVYTFEPGSKNVAQVVYKVFRTVSSRSGRRSSRRITNASQPELLLMILANLTTRHLNCALSVSKRWQGAILDSSNLRRTLFLSPASETDYFDHSHPTQWSPVIVHKPSQSSNLIIEAHPMLLDVW